ncbi:hypothetical protein [Streptomyces scopuliridis]|uniref:hypothetical protein n=1 Tax=Streptomyces scopuliridis TaxID=452529 RepID=UPI00341839D7
MTQTATATKRPAADPDTAGARADFDGDGNEDLVITDRHEHLRADAHQDRRSGL